MREHQANLVEGLAKTLEDHGVPQYWIDRMLAMTADAFAAGYKIGLSEAKTTVTDTVAHLRGNLCILSRIMAEKDQEFNDNSTLVGAWSACDTIGIKVNEALQELREEKLH